MFRALPALSYAAISPLEGVGLGATLWFGVCHVVRAPRQDCRESLGSSRERVRGGTGRCGRKVRCARRTGRGATPLR
jgi:hypothetical protein